MNLRCKKMKQWAKAFLRSHCKSAELQDSKENCKPILLNTLNVCRAARTENTALQHLLLLRNNCTNLKNSLNLFNKQKNQCSPVSNNFMAPYPSSPQYDEFFSISTKLILDLFPSTSPSHTRRELAMRSLTENYAHAVKSCDQRGASLVAVVTTFPSVGKAKLGYFISTQIPILLGLTER